MNIIGRDEEIRELEGYYRSGKPTGLANGGTEVQLAEFNKSLLRIGGGRKAAADWLEAFDCLREQIRAIRAGAKSAVYRKRQWRQGATTEGSGIT